jgi:dethiobiotin synthetase
MPQYFITSSGTNIGKTFVTAALLAAARARGIEAAAYKPLLSGFALDQIVESDSGQLLCALARDVTFDNLDEISPWRYHAPLAPHMAARLEGEEVQLAPMIAWCKARLETPAPLTLIEGVGGVMAPITAHETVRDWMVALNLPCVLVVGSYLGAMSHALTALEALAVKNLTVSALVISDSGESSIGLRETASELRAFVPASIPCYTLPRALHFADAEVGALLAHLMR